MGMEGRFEFEAPVFAPRFRSVVACLRLFFRPAGFSSRGTARAAYPPPIYISPASHRLGCFITGHSLFLTGYCQRTLSKFRITISNVPTTTSADHHKTGRPQYSCSARTLLLLRPAASSPVPPPLTYPPSLQQNKAISII